MAYVTLIYGGDKFLDGVILTGLGLRKQNTQYELVCLITEDCEEYKDIIKTIYDKVIVVPYISPRDINNSIKISKKIFKSDTYIDIFTKLNLFNKNLLNYDKIVFIDSDLIPIKYFDKLFELDAPAAWLEYKTQNDTIWHEWNLKMNDFIPKNCCDQTSPYGCSINGGLMVLKPDNNIYYKMIQELQNWNSNIKYEFPEQQYLTQFFINEWHYISGLYNAWGFDKINVYGIHMAGLYRTENNKKIYFKSWNFQDNTDNAYNFHTNLTFIYGLIKYPQIKDYILKKLYVSINNKLYNINEIISIIDLNELSPTQLLLINSL